MTIKETDRKGNEINEQIFSSFEEVFAYCLDAVTNMTPRKDDILFSFKIMDNGETFKICGYPNYDDSYIIKEIVIDD